MSTTRGVLYIHSAPSALCPHIEWAVGGVFGTPVRVDWIPQPVERACYRTEYSWTGPAGTAARLASALKGWQRIRFEVTEEATSGTEGERYSYTPTLGVFYADHRTPRRHHDPGGPDQARDGDVGSWRQEPE